MYCWRCGEEVAMLDEVEFATIESLYVQAVTAIKRHCRVHNHSTYEQFMQEQYRPVFEAYQRLTGREHTTDPSHLMYHRISKYGPPCIHCGKPLRTPQAKYCAACGRKKPA